MAIARKPLQKKSFNESVQEKSKINNKHLKTFCYSSEYNQSRNSADIFSEMKHYEDLIYEKKLSFQKKTSDQNQKKTSEIKPKKRTHSISNALDDIPIQLKPKRKLTTLESEINNVNHQVVNSNTLTQIKSRLTCSPLISLVESINEKLEVGNGNTNIVNVYLIQEIKNLQSQLNKKKMEHGKILQVISLRQLYQDQMEELEQLSQMEKILCYHNIEETEEDKTNQQF